MAERIPLILDVDTGIDDALALLYACASPEVELLAVTCTFGNAALADVSRNTLGVLALAGRIDVPVAAGPPRPLRRPLATAADTHGPTGIGHAALPPPSRALEEEPAPDLIVRLARERPGEVTLVTLGPLTNLAVALRRVPSLPGLLREHVLMGGAYRVPGNTTPTTEWNIHVDPDAAKQVFSAWAKATEGADAAPRPLAVGLDVTERARIGPQHLRHLAARAGALPADAEALAREPAIPTGSVSDNSVLRFMTDALRFYFEFHAQNDGFYGAFIHDPFAVAVAIDRSLIKAVPVFVDVEAEPGLAQGMTVADWRGLTRRPPNVDVAVDAEPGRFLDRFIDRVGGLAARHSGVAR